MLGFELDFWDYATFATLALSGVAIVVIALLIASLPGRIAIARKHPDAEAVKIMGYAGFLPVVPWIQAFIWAFKPTDIIDIRRLPKAEARAIDEDIARLKDEPKPVREDIAAAEREAAARRRVSTASSPATPVPGDGPKG
jgi:hypothetical protein